MHFSSSSSTVSFSFAGLFLLVLVSRELAVKVRSKSLFRLCSDCWSIATGPFFSGLSKVWTLAWGWDWRLTGPQMTVPWGELASDWLSELEVESSLNEVPLSPSPSPLWFLQQQSHGGEDQRDGPPGKKERELILDSLQSYFIHPFFFVDPSSWSRKRDSGTKRGTN